MSQHSIEIFCKQCKVGVINILDIFVPCGKCANYLEANNLIDNLFSFKNRSTPVVVAIRLNEESGFWFLQRIEKGLSKSNILDENPKCFIQGNETGKFGLCENSSMFIGKLCPDCSNIHRNQFYGLCQKCSDKISANCLLLSIDKGNDMYFVINICDETCNIKFKLPLICSRIPNKETGLPTHIVSPLFGIKFLRNN